MMSGAFCGAMMAGDGFLAKVSTRSCSVFMLSMVARIEAMCEWVRG